MSMYIIDKSSSTIMLYYSERPQLIAILSAATQKLSTPNTILEVNNSWNDQGN